MKLRAKLKSLWHRYNKWLSSHRWAYYVIGAVVLVLIAGSTAAILLLRSPARPATQSKPHSKVMPKPAPAVVYYSPLTGEVVADQASTTLATTAIMIENSPDARPQSGLRQAGVVYEAIAEGGITRFLALYQQAKPQLIGPVRSVRLYYIDWLAPYNASVAHIGGSQFALQEVRNGNYRDIDQFFNSGGYWRASDRYAPHNVYTSFEKLDALNAAKGYTSSSFTGFPRSDEKPKTPAVPVSVTVNISSPLYNASYTYDAATNTYLRAQAGEPHLDREEGQIAPKVVIAMHVNMSLVFEDGYRESIVTTGTGDATIFQNGTIVDASWSKASRDSQIQFTDKATGKAVALARGQVWVSAVPNDGGSVSWQ